MKKMPTEKRKKRYKTLAIIGNGFDMAHNYATCYESFVDVTSAESLDIFRKCCDKDDNITTWYSFEESIEYLTQKLFSQLMRGEHDYEFVNRERSYLRDVFVDIRTLLLQYLRQETENKPVVKLSAENDIILGYDYRDEACLAQYEDICWGKITCREALPFRRYLKYNLHLLPGSTEYNERISGLESYLQYENSGRGIDEELESSIPYYQFIKQFLNNYRKQNGVPDINYSKISTLVILGHGIKADQAFLSRIIKKCTHLKKVIIFRYAGESDESSDTKANFFRPYCKRIRSVMYR